MNILVIGACPYPAGLGSQVYLRASAEALTARGHQVRLAVYGWGETPDGTGRASPLHDTPVTTPDSGSGPRTSLIRARARGQVPERVHSGPARRKLLDDAALWHLLRRIRVTDPPDIVCAHNHEALAIAAMAGFRRIVYFAHNALAEELPWYATGARTRTLAGFIGLGADSLLPRRAAMVIAPHRRLAGYLVLRGCPPEKIRILPPPADSRLLALPLPTQEQLEACPPVVYAGNFDAYQNTGLLLRAMNLARLTRPNMRLVILSRDPAVIPGAEIVPDRGIETLTKILSQDIIMAIPRAGWSGYPIKLVNALAAGKPVVVTASAAWGIENNAHALVVKDNDERAFADALVRLVDRKELRLRLGRQARTLATEQHHPERYADQLDAMLREIQAGPKD